uniref:MATH and LRR domain-containing protein PFE0570w-like n=1 Tax=Diabrotica virgifera virgifera TaxID=50390 RepID=A0A6P7FUC8_DIAVI
MRERGIRRSQDNYRQRENRDYRDRRQNFRRDFTRRENENRDNGRGNYEQSNRQWNEDRYRENQNRKNTRTNQEDRNDNRRNEQENRGNRYGSDRQRENRRAVNNTQIYEYEDERQSDGRRSEEEQQAFCSRKRSLKTKEQTGIFCHPKEFIKLTGKNDKRSGSNLKFVDSFINEKLIKIMIDTGSEITLINRKLIEEADLTNLIYKISRVTLVGANKRTLATINEGIRKKVRLGKKFYALQCVIMTNMMHDMIVGVDELSEKYMVIDFQNNTMKITEEKEEEQDIISKDREERGESSRR